MTEVLVSPSVQSTAILVCLVPILACHGAAGGWFVCTLAASANKKGPSCLFRTEKDAALTWFRGLRASSSLMARSAFNAKSTLFLTTPREQD